ncbi:MAG: hypothetical protein JSR44_06715 [Spirochaetes bacterium]|nr:hypothetical protein [Spirochaetota bacterium]
MIKSFIFLQIVACLFATALYAESWVGLSTSGFISASRSNNFYCSDAHAPTGFSAGGFWGTQIFKNFIFEAGGSYQQIIANRLSSFNVTNSSPCYNAGQDYMYANYRQDFIILTLMPGYRQALSESFSLIFSAGAILNFNLGVTRDLVYFNKLSDPTLDATIQANAHELPTDEKEHVQTGSLVYQDTFTNIGFAGKIALAWQPVNSHFGLRLGTAVEKYVSTGTSTPGVYLMTSPVSSIVFRISIEGVYRL